MSRCACGGMMVVVYDTDQGLPRIKCSNPQHYRHDGLLEQDEVRRHKAPKGRSPRLRDAVPQSFTDWPRFNRAMAEASADDKKILRLLTEED